MKRGFIAAIALLPILVIFGCSGGTSPILPGLASPAYTAGQSNGLDGIPTKAVWGIWDVIIDPDTMDVTIVPLRNAEFTVDVVMFLQLPDGNPANLQIQVTDTSDFFTEGILNVDVGLTHPFPGLDQFTGFDVLGVVLGSGGFASYYDPAVQYSDGHFDLKLLNADGYTRWMNPTEFEPNGTILRFYPGALGTNNLEAITATINGYKYFADGLADNEDLHGFFMNPGSIDDRGKFSPSNTNWREFVIDFRMDSGFPLIEFQYAVLASWILPDPTLYGEPNVIDVPEDYPLSANTAESFLCTVTDHSNLYNDGVDSGGNIVLDLEIYDWASLDDDITVPGEISKITIESQGTLIPGGPQEILAPTFNLTAMPGTTNASSVFTVEIFNCMPQSSVDQELLITIEQNYGEFSPADGEPPLVDSPLASYLLHTVPVSDIAPVDEFQVLDPNGGETLWMALYHEITWFSDDPAISTVSIEFSTDDFTSEVITVVDSTENDGTYRWYPIPNMPTDTGKIRVTDPGGLGQDESDNYFSIELPVWLDFQDEVPVDDGTILWNDWGGTTEYDGTFSEYSPALSQDLDGLAHIAWHSEIVLPDVDPPHREARDTGIRSMDGVDWDGDAFFFTWGGSPDPAHELRGDFMKIAPAANNTTFAAIQHWHIYFSVDVDHFPNSHNYYNSGLLNNRIYYAAEIMADADYLYLVSDGYTDGINDGPGIYQERFDTPDFQWSAPVIPMTVMTDVGEVSHSRSWAFHGGELVMAYFTTDGTIKLLRQTDQVDDLWDDTEVIFDGAGYTVCKDPSISVDPTERMFAVWTGLNNDNSEYEILASMKETPLSAWTIPIVANSSATPFDDQHMTTSFEEVLLPTGDLEYMVLIAYSLEDAVYYQISPMDLWSFLPEIQVSDETDTSRDPDVLCYQAPYVYDALFAWSVEFTPEDWDIRFRNGDFVTP